MVFVGDQNKYVINLFESNIEHVCIKLYDIQGNNYDSVKIYKKNFGWNFQNILIPNNVLFQEFARLSVKF